MSLPLAVVPQYALIKFKKRAKALQKGSWLLRWRASQGSLHSLSVAFDINAALVKRWHWLRRLELCRTAKRSSYTFSRSVPCIRYCSRGPFLRPPEAEFLKRQIWGQFRGLSGRVRRRAGGGLCTVLRVDAIGRQIRVVHLQPASQPSIVDFHCLKWPDWPQPSSFADSRIGHGDVRANNERFTSPGSGAHWPMFSPILLTEQMKQHHRRLFLKKS